MFVNCIALLRFSPSIIAAYSVLILVKLLVKIIVNFSKTKVTVNYLSVPQLQVGKYNFKIIPLVRK
jgi:hypothetical protein